MRAAGGRPPGFGTAIDEHWLAFWNYCWSGTCADYSMPQLRDDVPIISVRRGETIRFHLPVRPDEVLLQYFDGESLEAAIPLEAAQTVDGKVSEDGYFLLSIDVENGSLSYVGRFSLRDG